MTKFNESQINPADVKSVFKNATALRDNPSGIGKVFSRLRKDRINVQDLQQAWKDEGFPDDTRDIERILKDHGFDSKEINKVLSQVIGDDEEDSHGNPAVQKIADYIKKNGMDQEIITFLGSEFGLSESIRFKTKLVIEDIRQIFVSMADEDRTARPQLIKAQEQTQLGRNRK